MDEIFLMLTWLVVVDSAQRLRRRWWRWCRTLGAELQRQRAVLHGELVNHEQYPHQQWRRGHLLCHQPRPASGPESEQQQRRYLWNANHRERRHQLHRDCQQRGWQHHGDPVDHGRQRHCPALGAELQR